MPYTYIISCPYFTVMVKSQEEITHQEKQQLQMITIDQRLACWL